MHLDWPGLARRRAAASDAGAAAVSEDRAPREGRGPAPAADNRRAVVHPVILQGIHKHYRLDDVDVPALQDIQLVILPNRVTVISRA